MTNDLLLVCDSKFTKIFWSLNVIAIYGDKRNTTSNLVTSVRIEVYTPTAAPREQTDSFLSRLEL